jgi:hypothetical protein
MHAVHWRFEESICSGHQLGLCFLRCGDGSVIDSGLHPDMAKNSSNISFELVEKKSCPRDGARGVIVSKANLVAAIAAKAARENVSIVYLATDGWIRGPSERALIKQVCILSLQDRFR